MGISPPPPPPSGALWKKKTLLPCPSCWDKLFRPCSYLSGYSHVIPSSREWRWSQNSGSKGDMTNILIFTVAHITCSLVNELICFVQKGNNSPLMDIMTNTMLQCFWKYNTGILWSESSFSTTGHLEKIQILEPSIRSTRFVELESWESAIVIYNFNKFPLMVLMLSFEKHKCHKYSSSEREKRKERKATKKYILFSL